MKFEFVPDLHNCRICQSTTNQREFWPEVYLRAGQTLRRCGHCGTVYLGPDFTEAALTRFYQVDYRKLFPSGMMGKNEALFFKQRGDDYYARKRYEILSSLIDPDSTLYELGSGYGSFLRWVVNTRPDVKLIASEPGIESRTKRLDPAAVTFIESDQLPTYTDHIDIAVGFHVFEHVVDPMQTLILLHQSLKVGGHIAIEVPDLFANSTTKKSFHPAHLTYFSTELLVRIFNAVGFRVVHAGVHPAGEAFAGTIWIVGQKLSTQTVDRNALAAPQGEIAAIDKHLLSLQWTAKDQMKDLLKAIVLRVLGPGWHGAILRFKDYHRSKRHWN